MSIFVPFVCSTQLSLNYQPISLLSPDPQGPVQQDKGQNDRQAQSKWPLPLLPAPT